MTITVKSVKLPSGYRKVAHIEFSTGIMGNFMTVAHFVSQIPGQEPAFFMYEHGKGQNAPKEISRDWYLSLLRKYYAFEPQSLVQV